MARRQGVAVPYLGEGKRPAKLSNDAPERGV